MSVSLGRIPLETDQTTKIVFQPKIKQPVGTPFPRKIEDVLGALGIKLETVIETSHRHIVGPAERCLQGALALSLTADALFE